jgi:hypothetical protein
LFKAIVVDVWNAQRTSLREQATQTRHRLQVIEQRLDGVEHAFIFERRIDRETYEHQRDKLREDATLLGMELQDAWHSTNCGQFLKRHNMASPTGSVPEWTRETTGEVPATGRGKAA